MTPLVHDALAFAAAAHASVGQKRRYSGDDYSVHPMAVAEIVRGIPHDDAMLAAALLHDVIEDVAPTRPELSLDEIGRRFGTDVAGLVGWLTDISRPADGNCATRKAIDRAHSAEAPARAQTIKVAECGMTPTLQGSTCGRRRRCWTCWRGRMRGCWHGRLKG